MTNLRGPGVKSVGKPDAGNRHVRFDERGRETGLLVPRPSSTLPIIWIARALHPVLHEYFLASCLRLGYVPRIVHEINTISELFDLVGASAGIGFVKKSISERVREPGVVFRDLSGPRLFIDTGVAYRADNRSEALRVLIQLLREEST